MDNTPKDPKKDKSFGEQLADDMTKAGKDFATNLKNDAKNMAKSWAWNLINGILGVTDSNIRSAAKDIIYKDGSGPSEVGSGNNYKDYAGYSRGPNYSAQKEDIGNRSAKEVKLITFRSKEAAEAMISDIYKMIDTTPENCCRVGDLYDMVQPKITASLADWKYGWSNKDKGRFDTRYIASGLHSGEWMIIYPEPHLV